MLSVERSNEPTQRQVLYKTKGTFRSQEEKRKHFLEEQKRKRNVNFDAGRNFEEIPEQRHEDAHLSGNLSKKKFGKMLMQSEWMEEVPGDLMENWYLVPCPVGKRCIVISETKICRGFSLSGKFLFQTSALLKEGKVSRTILDCIYSKETSTIFILDVILWAGYSMVNCETEFRFYWLKSKFEENPELLERPNAYKFHPLPHALATNTETALESLDFTEKLDGVLFYHKEAHYSAGVTPLVVWLLPFMIPEVLGISVNEELAQQPESYPGHLEYIAEYKKKRKEKRRRGRKSVEMDTSGSGHDESSIFEESGEPVQEEDELELG
ncbi:Hypothetical predicted protein [Cloeon dipterum]|uniref:Snurportin-1 n=1 Tax=Cloeon dipterum TaxID=197152 RepID=A0A8S1D777_9INSE|nr:Hypothetical predicted protein [Cloeon dipterum]